MNPQKRKEIDELTRYIALFKLWLGQEKIEVSEVVLGRLSYKLQVYIKENSIVVKEPLKLDMATIEFVYNHYKTKIQPKSRSIKLAIPKINARLKNYTKEQLISAIDLFSNDEWRMTHNQNQGAVWFFNSDARIEKFLEIEPRKRSVQGVYVEKTKTDYDKKTIKVNDK